MHRVKALILWGLMSISTLFLVGESKAAENIATIVPGNAVDAASVQTAHGRLPLLFVPNTGQMEARVQYSGQGPGYGVYFTPEEVVFAFVQQPPQSRGRETLTAVQARTASFSEEAQATRRVTFALRFLGANPEVRLEGQREGTGKVNYLIGSNPAQWHTGLSTYGEVVYQGLWPGVDLVFRAAHGGLKYEFVVQPGARIGAIQLAYRGVEGLALDAAGNLLIRTPLGVLTDARPQSYQDIDGKRVPVEGRFALESRAYGESTHGFEISSGYDPHYPLIIDPSLVYSTYLGGSGIDSGLAVAVGKEIIGGQPQFFAYVTGETVSTNFPTIPGAFQTNFRGGLHDAFVAKIDSSKVGAASLVYSTYLGGSQDDTGSGIAVDSAGNTYVIGSTDSANFPTKNASQKSNRGKKDVFAVKLNPTGSQLLYSTYLGGSGDDFGLGIAVDASGHAYLTGQTFSDKFPTLNAYRATLSGSSDAFVTKLSPTGSFVYSTYLGGSSAESGLGIAVDDTGKAYVTGTTASANFPTTTEVPPNGGLSDPTDDAFVAKLDPAATGAASLVYSTYLGGSGSDSGLAIAVGKEIVSGQPQFFACVTGETASTNFPTTTEVLPSGPTDAFVTKLSPTGSRVYSTYLGGSSDDSGNAIAVDGTGKVYVTGTTASTNFPTTGTFNNGLSGPTDAFVTKLDPAVTGAASLIYSTYLGGSSAESGLGIAVDDTGKAYVTGSTASSDFPTTAGAYDVPPGSGLSGPTDAFVTKLDPVPLLTVPGPQTVNEGEFLTFAVSPTNPANPLTYSASNLPLGATFDFDLTTATWEFAWTPNAAQGGLPPSPPPYLVSFTVSDGQFSDTKSVSITVLDTIADRDYDGVPDETDNCPDDYNPLQNDVCNPNSPQGAGDLSLHGAGINVTFCVTFTIGADTDTFVQLGQGGQLSLDYIKCTVTNTVTGEQIEPAGTPEFLPIGLLQDGILVPAGGSLSVCKDFTLEELGFDNLPSDVNLTVSCGYINFAQFPEPQPGDTKILTGTVTSPPQSTMLGIYDFTLIEPLLNQKVVNQVPVKFALTFHGTVVSSCRCKLFVQRLDSDGMTLIGNPMPAISASGEGDNVAQSDPSNNQYIFHLSTRNYPPHLPGVLPNGDLANGPWQVQIRPDDLSTDHNVTIKVQR